MDLSSERAVEPLLLPMTCYLVRRFGEDDAAAQAAPRPRPAESRRGDSNLEIESARQRTAA